MSTRDETNLSAGEQLDDTIEFAKLCRDEFQAGQLTYEGMSALIDQLLEARFQLEEKQP